MIRLAPLAAFALLACRGGSEAPAQEGTSGSSTPTVTDTETDTTPDTTTPGTTDTDTDTTTTTDTGTTDTGAIVAVIDEAPPNLTLAGLAVLCETDFAYLTAEFLGDADTLQAEPWLAGKAGDPVVLQIVPGDVFHTANQDEVGISASDCEATTWLWTLSAGADSVCKVHGPDAADVLAAHPGCELH